MDGSRPVHGRSRAVDDPELSDEILEATATELGRR
jgi:hypothetical protein